MKFAHKIFFATTAVLTLSFAVFGIWLLTSYFQRIQSREMEQASVENRMFQYLFEMAYQSAQDYGEDLGVRKALDSIMNSVEKDGTRCFVLNEDGDFLYGGELAERTAFAEVIRNIWEGMEKQNTYAYQLYEEDNRYFLFGICTSDTGEHLLGLGMCTELTEIYEDRRSLMNQYRLALLLLLLVGGTGIYWLSHYMTRPIRRLKMVAGRIAAGDYDMRSGNRAQDEIGELAASFNKMADRLIEQMKEKELEAKQKEDFTAAFAHELKTPLTSIIGYADMLNSLKMTEEECREAYFYIYSQGKRLESLSHKLLELVSMEKETVKMLPVAAKDLEENLRAAMRPIWKEQNIQGKITMEKGVIYGDFELLLSLLYNLLDNARKAVDEGGFILLKGKCLETGYEIKVVDSGRGIPKEEIERITEAFYMVDKSRSRKEGGAGIGMALCKRIMTIHGGSLYIDSRLGEGTVIRLLFPKERKGQSLE